MLKLIMFFLPLFFQFNFCYAQKDTLTDLRDEQRYEVIQIGEKRWFKDFLKYETNLSHCPNFNKKEGDCTAGNYYNYLDLDTICPSGWHVSTAKEWEAYIEFLKQQKQISSHKLKTEHTKPNMPNFGFMVTDTSEQIQLFAASNDLNLSPLGWVEGNKVKKYGTLTIWVRKDQSTDAKYHLHIGPNRYIEHTHKHHIIDKPKKRRKFLVKCVCDEEGDGFK